MDIGTNIYAVFGDDFIEPITKQHGIIKAAKDNYYIADDQGIEFTVFVDETLNNLDFNADIGTDYRVFTDEENADRYFNYLKEKRGDK